MQVTPGPLNELGTRFSNYLPTLTAGLIIVLLGLVTGWLVKRAVIAFLKWVRLDRLGGPTSWRAALAKADVRDALYNVIGSITYFAVVLIFLDNALQIWGLTVLSDVVDRIIRYFPNMATVALIVGIGLLLANLVADRVEDVLQEAGIPNPQLIGSMSKAALLAVVAALALWELDFARQIVMGAFLIGFGAIGVAFALAVGIGSSQAIRRSWEELFESRRNNKQGQ